MKQYARVRCACSALALATPTASPFEFDVSCAICGRKRTISWASDQPPPEFVRAGAQKIAHNGNHGGRKPGTTMPVPDVIGKTFGDLEVLEFAGMKNRRRTWRCRCVSTERTGSECGNIQIVETKILNHVGGRRCRQCNQHVLRQRATNARHWMYKLDKPATAKGKA